MIDKDAILTAGRSGRARRLGAAMTITVALGCLVASPASAQSFGDRIKSLFGGEPSKPAENAAAPAPGPDNGADTDCPPVNIRSGASTYAVAAPGKQPVGSDLRYQATITRTARDCTRNGGEITAHIGIQGRVIAGPAGAPSTVEVPLRVAVVQGGIGEKVIATKAYRTTVQMSEDGSVPFTLVVEDLAYPVPPGGTADSYVFYIGFDPQALTPEKRVVKKKK